MFCSFPTKSRGFRQQNITYNSQDFGKRLKKDLALFWKSHGLCLTAKCRPKKMGLDKRYLFYNILLTIINVQVWSRKIG
ncbi:unnamed protein product [Gordionus sp. m RMFG-2023]